MSLTNFVQSIWASAVETALRKRLVAYRVATTKFEGEARRGGVVKIQKAAGLTVAPYAPGTPISYSTPTSTNLDLVIDQSNVTAFGVDDIYQVQSQPDLVATYSVEGGVALATAADAYVLGLATNAALNSRQIDLTLAGATNTWDNVYDKLTEAAEVLDADSAPTNRFVIASPRLVRAIRLSDDFTSASDLGDSVKTSGIVGQIAGFDVLESANVAKRVIAGDTPGSADVLLAGSYGAVAYADQIEKVEALRAHDQFEDRVRALHVFGSRILEPAALVRLDVTTLAPIID